MTNFCKYCHYDSDYMHYHTEYKIQYGERVEVRVKDGKWTDVNKICLPCQCMKMGELGK